MHRAQLRAPRPRGARVRRATPTPVRARSSTPLTAAAPHRCRRRSRRRRRRRRSVARGSRRVRAARRGCAHAAKVPRRIVAFAEHHRHAQDQYVDAAVEQHPFRTPTRRKRRIRRRGVGAQDADVRRCAAAGCVRAAATTPASRARVHRRTGSPRFLLRMPTRVRRGVAPLRGLRQRGRIRRDSRFDARRTRSIDAVLDDTRAACERTTA